jgi:hypothetical protein
MSEVGSQQSPSQEGEELRPPYVIAAPKAQYFKAALQMLVGLVAVGELARQLLIHWLHHATIEHVQVHVFEIIGFALAVAAAIELAYTLFTPGPDEALDPLMLGLSAALILQLGKVESFQWTQALAALLYITGLAVLFVVRRRLAATSDVPAWSFIGWLRSRSAPKAKVQP